MSFSKRKMRELIQMLDDKRTFSEMRLQAHDSASRYIILSINATENHLNTITASNILIIYCRSFVEFVQCNVC